MAFKVSLHRRRLTAPHQNAPNNVFIAFIGQVLCNEADFKDLLLVEVVQRAEGVFQPTIAVRVPA